MIGYTHDDGFGRGGLRESDSWVAVDQYIWGSEGLVRSGRWTMGGDVVGLSSIAGRVPWWVNWWRPGRWDWPCIPCGETLSVFRTKGARAVESTKRSTTRVCQRPRRALHCARVPHQGSILGTPMVQRYTPMGSSGQVSRNKAPSVRLWLHLLVPSVVSGDCASSVPQRNVRLWVASWDGERVYR
jgi:hypothetical protein